MLMQTRGVGMGWDTREGLGGKETPCTYDGGRGIRLRTRRYPSFHQPDTRADEIVFEVDICVEGKVSWEEKIKEEEDALCNFPKNILPLKESPSEIVRRWWRGKWKIKNASIFNCAVNILVSRGLALFLSIESSEKINASDAYLHLWLNSSLFLYEHILNLIFMSVRRRTKIIYSSRH